MADPQLERGYTRIANELLEAICRLNISGNEMRILLFIIRRTYGFNRRYAEISLSEIASAVGMRTVHISRALKKLSDFNIIELHSSKGTKPQTISIEKNYEEWSVESYAVLLLPKMVTVTEIGNPTITKNGNHTYKDNKNNIKNSFKESKTPFGKNEKVFLSTVEYDSLVKEYGKEIVARYINRMDNWLASRNKTITDCYSELLIWMDRDDVKKSKDNNDGFDAEKYKIFVNDF